MTDDKNTLVKQMAERYAQLPKVVQDAITSADVAERLRELSDSHKLHLDQWERLENEVMLALLGFQRVEDLPSNIKNEVRVDEAAAAALAADVSRVVFEPIRQELERELEHPEAKAGEVSGVDAARTQILKDAGPAAAAPVAAPMPPTTSASQVAPAMPPPPPPTEKAIRMMPTSGAYKPGVPSHERKDVHDDPYRETPA